MVKPAGDAGAADDADPGADGSQQRQNLDHDRTACLHTTRHGPGPLSVHADLDVIPDGKAGPPAARAPGTPRRELICARRGRPAESLTRSTARAVWSGSRSGPRRSGSRVSPPNVTNTLTVKSNMHRRDRLERDLLLSPPPRRPWRQSRGGARVLTATGPSAAPRRLPDRPPAAGKRRPTAVLRTGCARHRSRTPAPASSRRRPRPFPAARQRSARQRRPRLQQRHRTREAANAGPNDPDDSCPSPSRRAWLVRGRAHRGPGSRPAGWWRQRSAPRTRAVGDRGLMGEQTRRVEGKGVST